jgi:hypothetical protein
MIKICKKAAQDFHRTVSKVFDRVKSVALWSANIRKLAKDHKGYGSAASECIALCLLVGIVKILIFITVDIFKHCQKNKKIKRADQILPEVYGTNLSAYTG